MSKSLKLTICFHLQLNEASEKIDELMQANQYLNQAKENAVKLSGK